MGHTSCFSDANNVPLVPRWVFTPPPFQKSLATAVLGQVGPAFTFVQIAFEDVSNRGNEL